jgi:hypothetical protein
MSHSVAAEHCCDADRCSITFAALASALIITGGLVAAVNSAAPFTHGSWLAAYLVLVGGVSQFVLGLGRLALPAPLPSAQLRRAQVVLWNAGSLVVVGGVLTDVAPLVTLGSAFVLAALACFAAGARLAREAPGALGLMVAYHAVVMVLAVSVIIGSVLAYATPGG